MSGNSARRDPAMAQSSVGQTPRCQILWPKPVYFNQASGLRREPIRPPNYQDGEFARQFDYTTMFFDCFFENEGPRVILPAPPFLNLQALIEQMELVALPSGQHCEFSIESMDRLSQVWVNVPTGTTHVTVRSSVGQFLLTPTPNNSNLFEDKRVLVTLSKNNRLEWIQDWMRYNRDIHGANAVLFYDNQSTSYSLEELLHALTEVNGFDCICVVAWPFTYGPQGLDAVRFWDSDFCQIGALAHARWRFLQLARSVLNSDVDELVVSTNGSSVFDAVERSASGVVRFHGVWVHGFSDRTPVRSEKAPVRYTVFDHFRQPPPKRRFRIIPIFQGDCPPKWAVVPRRCPEKAQWTAHTINDWYGARGTDRSFCYRHFREINDHWKYDRSKRESFDSSRYVYDEAMVSNFNRVHWTG